MLTEDTGLVEQQITEFVTKHVTAADKDKGHCKKFILRHLNIEKKPRDDVTEVKISTDPALLGLQGVDRIVMELAHAAQKDANDMRSGVQTYAIYAYYTNNPNFAPRKIFRVNAEEEIDRESGPSEPPNEKGLTQQLMRHLEVVSKNALVGMGYIMQTFQKEISQQREMNRQFMTQQIDLSILVQEILNDGHKRQIEAKQAELQVSVIEGVFEHLKVALPILVNKLANKEILPTKMDKELYLLSTLLENLTAEQQNQLQNMLDPKQLVLLSELLGGYEERKRKMNGDSTKRIESGEKEEGEGSLNKMVKLFEKRRTLVAQGKATEIKDERSQRIERKAEKIRERLQEVGRLTSEEK